MLCEEGIALQCFWWSLFVCLRVRLYVCSRKKKLKNCWGEIDVTWHEHVLWWAIKVIKFSWHVTLTFALVSYFVIFLNKKIVNNVKTAGQMLNCGR